MPASNKLDDDVKKREQISHQDMDGYDAKKKHSKKDPRVTISDSLVIDVDGILDNDDEVSLETPVTIPENPEPNEFGRAVTDALDPSKKVSSESERSVAVRFSSVKDSAKSDSAKVSNNNMRGERKAQTVIKSKLKSTVKLDRLTSEVNSDNLSDSTVSTSNKTSGGSRTSSRTSQKVLKDAKVPKRRVVGGLKNGQVEKKIGKAKLPNGLNDVTDASANPSLEDEKGDTRPNVEYNGEKESGKRRANGDERPPILAPWEEKSKKEGKPNSGKNKPRKIDIDELQNDMGKYNAYKSS